MTENPIKVLMVEDNAIHQQLIQHLMKNSRLNAHFVIAESLKEGLSRIVKENFDVVLLDLVLPDSNGITTLEKFRSAEPNLPVIILTGLDDISLAAATVELGAQDYIVKTNANTTLLSRSIHYAIERTRARSGEWDSGMFQLAQQQFLKQLRLWGLMITLENDYFFLKKPT